MRARELASLSDQELPNRDIKVAFFDIDGTLLGLEGRYSADTRDEIARIKSLGVSTAVASGRPNFAAQFIIDELMLDDAGCFSTGAHIFLPKENRTIRFNEISKHLCRQLIVALRETDIYYEIYTEQNFFVENDNRQEIRCIHAEHMRQAPVFENFDSVLGRGESIVKLLIAVDCAQDHAQLFALEQAFSNCDFAYAKIAAYPEWLFASIIDRGACKHQAFDFLLEYYGVKAENVISFGDAHSDMVFLERAGIGVAMGQANDEVKAVADYVTLPVWEDGVPYALSRLVK